MSNLKYCQGPDCHTYTYKGQIKGTKGNKTYQTRRRSQFLLFRSWKFLFNEDVME